jgi:hypothetical protein
MSTLPVTTDRFSIDQSSFDSSSSWNLAIVLDPVDRSSTTVRVDAFNLQATEAARGGPARRGREGRPSPSTSTCPPYPSTRSRRSPAISATARSSARGPTAASTTPRSATAAPPSSRSSTPAPRRTPTPTSPRR